MNLILKTMRGKFIDCINKPFPKKMRWVKHFKKTMKMVLKWYTTAIHFYQFLKQSILFHLKAYKHKTKSWTYPTNITSISMNLSKGWNTRMKRWQITVKEWVVSLNWILHLLHLIISFHLMLKMSNTLWTVILKIHLTPLVTWIWKKMK